MLAARLLTRAALGAPKAAAPLAAAVVAGGPWTSILEPYAGKSLSHATFTVSGTTNTRDEAPSGRFRGATLLPPPALHRGLATDTSGPGSGPTDTSGPGSGPEPAGAGGFMALSAAHATLASVCFIAPEVVANAFFPGVALPQGFQTQALVQILGCGLAAGSASCFAVRQAAEHRELASPTAQRLQLGLLSFSAAIIGTHLMYSPAITVASLGAGAVVMGATGAAAYKSYTAATRAAPSPGSMLSRYFGAVPDHLRISGAPSAMFSLLTPVLAAAGASYLFLPGATLAAVFGFVKDVPSSMFFWQSIGGSLLTVAPAMTYSLKKEADEGRLGGPVAKTLCTGLMVAALGHLAVLAPMLGAGQGGEMLPWVVGAWTVALGAGGLGLVAGSAGAAGGAAGAGGGGAAA